MRIPEINRDDILADIIQHDEPVLDSSVFDPEGNPLNTCSDISLINNKDIFTNWIGHWRKGEWLWGGQLSPELISFDSDKEILSDIRLYFVTESWLKEIPSDYPWDATLEDNDMHLENLLKLVWLTNEYVNADFNFENAVGGHWNPRERKIHIHPGGCRNKVIKIFQRDVEIIFFNTGGFNAKWMTGLKPLDVFKLVEDGWAGSVVADHGTMIPHLLKDLQSIVNGKEKWHLRLKDTLGNHKLKIYSDIRLPYLSDWHVKNPHDASVLVKFHKEETHEIELNTYFQAILCVLAEVNIDNKHVTVQHI